MPWKVTSEMHEKVKFIADCLRGDKPMTVTCERCGISRETGYVWWRRYAASAHHILTNAAQGWGTQAKGH
jgi:putative transposase